MNTSGLFQSLPCRRGYRRNRKNSIKRCGDIFLNGKAEKIALLICKWTKREQGKSKGIQKVRAVPEHLCTREKEKMKHTNVRFVTEKVNTQESFPEDRDSDNLMGY